VAVGAGESVVEVDAPLGDAEVAEAVALGREVLVVGGAAGVADQRAGHPENVTDSPRSLTINSYNLCETLLVAATAALRLSAAVSVWGSAYGQPSARWRAELSRGVLAFRLRGGMGRRCANLAARPPPAEPSREKIGCTYPQPASWWTVAAATSGLSSKTRRTASARSCAARRRTRQRVCHDGNQRRVNVRPARRRQERAHQRRWRRQRSRRSRCPPAASRSPRWLPSGRSGVSGASPPRVARPDPCRGVS